MLALLDVALGNFDLITVLLRLPSYAIFCTDPERDATTSTLSIYHVVFSVLSDAPDNSDPDFCTISWLCDHHFFLA